MNPELFFEIIEDDKTFKVINKINREQNLGTYVSRNRAEKALCRKLDKLSDYEIGSLAKRYGINDKFAGQVSESWQKGYDETERGYFNL